MASIELNGVRSKQESIKWRGDYKGISKVCKTGLIID